MSRPTVSILMTAYNRAAFIEAALDSVLASDYSDFEVIVVDDHSSDDTFDIAGRAAARDDRVRLYRNDRNLGDYPNRNRAARLARGRYLKYVDSDDILYPHGLGVMVAAMQHFPDAALGVSRGPTPDFPYPALLSPEQAYRRHFLGGGLLGHGPLGTIIRTDAFRQAGGFSGKRYVGDVELWLKIAARFPVVIIQPGLVWWRQHDGQEFARGQDSGSYPHLKYRVLTEALTDSVCPLPPVERAEALRGVNREHARDILGAVRRGHIRTAVRLYRDSRINVSAFLGRRIGHA